MYAALISAIDIEMSTMNILGPERKQLPNLIIKGTRAVIGEVVAAWVECACTHFHAHTRVRV